MAVNILSQGSASGGGKACAFVVDYDTVTQTIGATITGQGHTILTALIVASQTPIVSVNCDQFNNDGVRHIVAGPGAVGTVIGGGALPTSPISAAVVGAFNVPKGQVPGLAIGLSWTP